MTPHAPSKTVGYKQSDTCGDRRSRLGIVTLSSASVESLVDSGGSVGRSDIMGSVVPSSLAYFPSKVIFSLHRRETQLVLVALFATTQAYAWTKTRIREVFMYRYILNHRKHFMRPSLGHWIMLATIYPVLGMIAWMVYNVFATWAMMSRAQKHNSVVYVTAPKGLNSSTEPSEKKETRITRAATV
jgi:hypothetical protein